MKEIETSIEEIALKYEKGISLEDLATQYQVSTKIIYNRLKAYYEEKRPTKKRTRTIEIPIETIVLRYEQGAKIVDLAEEFQVSVFTINERLNEYYEKIEKDRPYQNEHFQRKEIPIEEIVLKYEQDISIEDIAKEYQTSISTINKRLNEYYERIGRRRPKQGHKKTKIAMISIKEVVLKYEHGTIMEELAREYQVSTSTISKMLVKHYEKNGKKRPIINGDSIKEIQIEKIILEYEKGTSFTDLAIKYGLGSSTISKRINDYYKEKGKKTPRILRSKNVLEEYLRKGMTIEAIIEITSKRNIIIPRDLIDAVLKKVTIAHDEER